MKMHLFHSISEQCSACLTRIRGAFRFVGNRGVATMVGGVAVLVCSPAAATGDALRLAVGVTGMSQRLDAIPAVDIALNSDSVFYVTVASTLESGQLTIAETEDQEVPIAAFVSGEKLVVPSLVDHRFLAPGYYGERLQFTIWDAALDIPVNQSVLRFFFIEEGVVYPITSGEYTDATIKTVDGFDRAGKKVRFQAGTGLDIAPVLPAKLQYATPVTDEVRP
jgi:hypothetical protein